MYKVCFLLLTVTAAGAPGLAAPIEADARRGAEFFGSQGCVNCHSSKGAGAGKAPDLGRRLDRDYTPAGIAARMWSHAPVMWEAMGKENITPPKVSPQQAADLFAYFYAARYFEKPGEAERGKRYFQDKHCIDCHALTGTGGGPGPPVEKWESLAAPIILIERMWNHQTQMHNAMAARGIPWPQMSSQELSDLLVYLQNLPQTRGAERFIQLPAPEPGEALFRDKGCVECHKGNLALENRLSDSTLTDIAAAMWNHAPQMRQPPPTLTIAEWRELISYVWGKQFFTSRGDAGRGRKTFESKKCATCHNDASSGAPSLTKPAEPYSAISVVSVLWRHGPAMLRKMEEKHIAWPQLSQNEMANLIAYLNSR
ncbi:MAG: c-type cytochrome [Acidobacteriia bacterium]|nr:c-type cytochrome [Terriglobia bacterium]